MIQNSQIQGTHPPAGYPLHRAHTIREEAAPYYEDILNHGHRAHIPQAGYPLHRAHTIREVGAPQYYMGVDPGVRPVVRNSRESSYLHNPTQTTDQRP